MTTETNEEKFTVEVVGEETTTDTVETPDKPEAPAKTAAPAAPKVEVVDDTPARDRNRGAPIPKELLTEVTEEELAGVSEKMRNRIERFTRGYHDERREKERKARELEAAEAMARQLLAEKRALEQQLATGSTEYIANATALAESTLQNAQREYQEAFEANDGAKMAEAQAKIARAAVKMDQVKGLKPLQVPKTEVQTPQQPQLNPKLQAWRANNPWFGSNRAMTAYATLLHDDVVKKGLVAGSDAYYEAIDEDVRRRFPEEFGSTEIELPADQTPTRTPASPAARQTPKTPAVVAGVSRGTASTPGVVRITKAQADIARRLGVPLEAYAAQFAKLNKENSNG